MLIDCPKCRTRFRISGDKLRPEGTKLKCSSCGHIFRGSVYDAMTEKGETRGRQQAASSRSASGLEDLGEEPGQARGKKRKWPWLAVLFLLLAAVLAYMFFSGMTARISFLQEPSRTTTTGLDQRSDSEGAVQDIALRNVSQYMVQNKHIGSLLVIEGRAMNRSEDPKKGIELRASVFDKQGKELLSKEFFCGKSVSLAQLQSFRKKELQAAFSSDLARLSERKRVDKGESVPFMVIFFSPPQDMAEFSLRVLRAGSAKSS